MRLLLLAAFLTPGCAPRPLQADSVREAGEGEVRHCRYLEMVYGSSAWRGAFAERGISEARAAARERARRLGATHVIWTPIGMRADATEVSAKAYRCR